MNEISSSRAQRSSLVLQSLRSLIHALAVGVIAAWGFLNWPLPWPGLITGLGALIVAVLLWALFLSPRPVLHTDRFGQSLIELLLIAGAVAALLTLGVHPIIAVLFGLVGAVLGYLAGTARTHN